MRRLAILALLAFATSSRSAAQETVLLRLRPAAGQVTRYRTTAETWMTIPGMADAADTAPALRVLSLSTATVTAVSGDTLTILLHRDSTDFQSSAMPQIAEMARANLANQPADDTVRIDARGRPVGPAGAAGGYLPSGRFLLPDAAVPPGATWRDSTSEGAGEQGMQLTSVTDYRLERVDREGRARIAVISVRQVQSGGNEQAQLTQTTTLELRIDLTAGRVLVTGGETNGEVVSVNGAMPIRARMRVEAF